MRRTAVVPIHATRVSLLTLLCLGAAGCHKKVPAASQPSPPARTSSHASSSHPAQSTRPYPAPPPVTITPSAPDIRHSKPISTETGLASWYGPPYNKRKGADGSVYDENALTAAHRTLPMGSTVRVTNLETNQSVTVRITDRGPFISGRLIDLSLAAAKATGVYRMGVAKVRVEAYAPPAQPIVTTLAGHTPPPPIAGGRWCVQIGAMIVEEDAIQLKNDLASRYASAKVIEFKGPTGFWVRINPKQPDKLHASEISDSIHLPDAEPYLVRLD